MKKVSWIVVITGAVGMHSAAKVQYVRPEIIGLVLGAFIMSVATKEFRAKAGSSPATRFVLGAFVMIGALAFLGCPLRMVLRMGGGDLNAVVGLVGFTLGIFIGIQFLSHFGNGVYQPRSASCVIDTHKVHFIVGKVHHKSLSALLRCVAAFLSSS